MKRTIALGAAWTASAGGRRRPGFPGRVPGGRLGDPTATRPVAASATTSVGTASSTAAAPRRPRPGEQSPWAERCSPPAPETPRPRRAPATGWWVDDSAAPGRVEFRERHPEGGGAHPLHRRRAQFSVEGPRADGSGGGRRRPSAPRRSASPASVRSAAARSTSGARRRDPSGRDRGGPGADDGARHDPSGAAAVEATAPTTDSRDARSHPAGGGRRQPWRRPPGRLRPVLLRMSSLFLRTLRDDPADAEVPSHRLLARAGYIRRAAPGVFTWLPLGFRVIRNVERVVREEMDAMGAQEVHFPALLPREPYEATGRWTEYGDNLFRLQGPPGRRLPARPHPRGDVHAPREGPVLAPTRTCRSRSTRSRPSTATRRGPAPACSAAASSR